MHKFKPGDKVKIVSNKYDNYGYKEYTLRPYLIIKNFYKIGSKGALTGALYNVQNCNGYYVWEDDLRLVNIINLKLI